MLKRISDIFIALVSIIILIFPFCIISVIFRINSSDSILYWSKRSGINSIFFLMPKIRTMKAEAPEVASRKLISPHNYITPFGSFLRRTSLDEIPQFFSVLIGDMSIVGPRPALYNEYDIIDMRRKLGIDKLKPGITGWAQINGRDDISSEDKVRLDFEYLKRQSIFFDLKIIILTIVNVVSSKDITH